MCDRPSILVRVAAETAWPKSGQKDSHDGIESGARPAPVGGWAFADSGGAAVTEPVGRPVSAVAATVSALARSRRARKGLWRVGCVRGYGRGYGCRLCVFAGAQP